MASIKQDSKPLTLTQRRVIARAAYAGMYPTLWAAMQKYGNAGGKAKPTDQDAIEWIQLMTPRQIHEALATDGYGVAQQQPTVSFSLELVIQDPVRFRRQAHDHALKTGTGRPHAAEYLNEAKTGLDDCALLLLDPGLSIAGVRVICSDAIARQQ